MTDNPHSFKPGSQNAQILEALQAGEQLTGLEILRRFNCMNYKGRISDLRQAGFNIDGEWIKTPTGKRIMRYFMPRPGQQAFAFAEAAE